VKIFKYAMVAIAASVTLPAVHACTILEFGAENLLWRGQNTRITDFQELAAFASDAFPTQPVFPGRARFVIDLNAPMDLTGYGYAVIHYAAGTSGNPALNQGGTLDFYFISARHDCEFTFPEMGPGGRFSNGRITSVTLFFSEAVPDAGTTIILFAVGLSILGIIPRFAKG
jgi:hypothetical protein